MKDPQPAMNNEIEAAVEFINNFDIVPVPVGGQDASNNRTRLLYPAYLAVAVALNIKITVLIEFP
ncbi:unnamed protein product [Acanthoscelides obtectus]|uniref:Uncharacterized protein n=1 Tax=Acanthoscelides obtectus TaxID=200917 RepID=A0A9P0K8F0_ACAOB|nr:unnamed protein product [Acanthoscelides obtectus]CAK1622822.1 hypothetical protein AOBTE_LOCUS1685 [Acanthoscelides obtectus]